MLGPKPVDAFIGALLRSLPRLKVAVPHKVRVVGLDDVKFATLVSPALTALRQPCQEIAIAAFRALEERLSDPTSRCLVTRWVDVRKPEGDVPQSPRRESLSDRRTCRAS